MRKYTQVGQGVAEICVFANFRCGDMRLHAIRRHAPTSPKECHASKFATLQTQGSATDRVLLRGEAECVHHYTPVVILAYSAVGDEERRHLVRAVGDGTQRVSSVGNPHANSNRASQVRFLTRKPGRRTPVDLSDLSSTAASQPEPADVTSFSTVTGAPRRAQEAGRLPSFPTRTSSASLLRGSLAALSSGKSCFSAERAP